MRIDPNNGLPQSVQSDQIQGGAGADSSKAAQESKGATSNGGVQVQLSTSSTQVNALAQQAAAVPPVRTDRVEALRQTIRNGNYNVTNEQVAAAMYSDMFASGTNE